MRISGRENSFGAEEGRDKNAHPKNKNLGGETSKKGLAVILTAVLLISAMPAIAATDWPQFQKDEVNIGRTSDSAPINDPLMAWRYNTGGGGWSGVDTTPIVGEGKVFVINYQGYLYAFDAKTGDYLWDTFCNEEAGTFELAVPAYHNGIVYVATSKGAAGTGHGRVTALYANNGTIREYANIGFDGFQLNTPVTYADGKIYVGNWKGGTATTEDNGTYYCLDASNVANEIWHRTSPYVTGYYWAGAAIIGPYVVYGDDRANVTCLNKDTGVLIDYINVSVEYGINAKEIRSSIAYNATYDRIYFTSKGGYAFAIGFDASTGQFNTTGDRDWNSPRSIGYSTSTPAVYDSRVYVGQGGFGANGKVYCLNESDGTEIWSTPNLGGVQSSPALSVSGGQKYIYFTINNEDGSAYCLEDIGSTYTTRWIWNPPLPDEQYILQGVAISDGYVYFGTDEGYVYGLKPPAAVNKSDLTVTAIDNETIYSGTYNIITATIENVGNGSAVTFNVTLDDGSGVVDTATVTSLGAGDSTAVKFAWTPASTSPCTLNVTADSDNVIDEYDETNNSMTKGVTPSDIPQTDLVVSEVNDGDVSVNEPNVIFAVIRNEGADASGFNVSLEMNGAENDTIFVPSLVFRDSQLVTFDWAPSSTGSKQINVTVDCDNDVAESNEGNNMTSQTVNAATFAVTNVASGQSIQTAINGASSSTKIVVNAGTYNEQVTIPASKSGIRLIANGTGVVICNNNAGDVVTVEGPDCWVQGFEINSTWEGTYANHPGAGINVTSKWNVIEDNYIYNSSGGIKLYGAKNQIESNTVGDSEAGRACLNLMAISGDCNAIVKNKFDGDTGHGWILGGTYTGSGIRRTTANDNIVRDNDFTVTGVGGCEPGDLVFGGDPNLVFNNIINDISNHVELGELNWYNVTNTTGPNIMGGPYLGGNYWSNYTGVDANEDGFGDTPYRYDQLPLMKWSYTFDIPIYNGKNLIAVPLIQDNTTLAAVFGDDPVANDKVHRYNNGLGLYKTSRYTGTAWWHPEYVEPIEPEVGYVCERVGADYTLTTKGTRCTGTISTPIYNGKNLIGYVNFTETTLSATFGSNPVANDKVHRYNNGLGLYKTSRYTGTAWWHPEYVEPIEVGVGYVYERVGADFDWTYEA